MHEKEMDFTEDLGLTALREKCHITMPMGKGFVWGH